MNKSELIRDTANKVKESDVVVKLVLNTAITLMKKALQDGDDVFLSGFGRFHRKLIKPRKVFGDKTVSRLRWHVYFKMGSDLRRLKVASNIKARHSSIPD